MSEGFNKIEISYGASSQVTYPILVGVDLLGRIGELIDLSNYSKIGVLTDEVVGGLWGDKLRAGIGSEVEFITISGGEKGKSTDSLVSCWENLRESGFDRNSLLINLGGGAVGDLGGFVAGTYMRGIRFIQVPTTLLAQVDASVGGKTAINFGEVKNLVGLFNQPQAVIIDISTLKTLPKRELVAGYAEVIKHGFIRSQEYLDLIGQPEEQLSDTASMIKLVSGSCEIKADVVNQDEKEGGLRRILNFGHTIGHALESISHRGDAPILHGEAIGIGMVAEGRLSFEEGLITEAEFQQIEKGIADIGLPIRAAEQVTLAEVKELILSDKKNVGGSVKWTLLEGIGNCIFDREVADSKVEDVLQYIGVSG